MGTRVDFYVGRGEQAEWLGSNAFDGYPDGVFGDGDLFSGPITEDAWREWVAGYLTREGDSATVPPQGCWPWPWNDSLTTDYAYAWDAGVVYGSNWGYGWWAVDPDGENWGQRDADTKTAVFPDMGANAAVTYGPRSGVMIFGVEP